MILKSFSWMNTMQRKLSKFWHNTHNKFKIRSLKVILIIWITFLLTAKLILTKVKIRFWHNHKFKITRISKAKILYTFILIIGNLLILAKRKILISSPTLPNITTTQDHQALVQTFRTQDLLALSRKKQSKSLLRHERRLQTKTVNRNLLIQISNL